jgi:hypothetical protein
LTVTITFSVAPATLSISQGGSATYTVSGGAGFSGTVDLQASGLPTGATATFTPKTLAGSGSALLVVTTTLSTPVGSSNIQVIAASGTFQQTAVIQLNVSAPSNTAATVTFNVNPTTATVKVGQSAMFDLMLTASSGTVAPVQFNCTGLPSGAICNFVNNPASGTSSVATATLTIVAPTTLGALGSTGPRIPSLPLYAFWFGNSLIAGLVLLQNGRLKKSVSRSVVFLGLISYMVLAGTLCGCGGGGGSSTTSAGRSQSLPNSTPFTVTVQGTALANGQTVQLTPVRISLVVTQ